MSSATLEVNGLVRSFGGLTAVDGVDLTLNKGEIIGVIGPNGAGKSTLINVITGIYLPGAGTITYRGEDVTAMPAHERSRRGIGRTYQLIHPFEDLNCIENIMVGALFARRMSMRRARIAAGDLCELVGLKDPARRISALTILEVKKMEIAHALAIDPGVLFLDEVMAGLNVDETGEIVQTIRHVTREMGLAVGVVEHVMHVIRELTHRVIVLDAGKVIAEGPYVEVAQDARVIQAYLGGDA
jgi:branched-chain amino acid transport system ATP-binding protein